LKQDDGNTSMKFKNPANDFIKEVSVIVWFLAASVLAPLYFAF